MLVPIKIAKELKKIGFNTNTLFLYNEEDEPKIMFGLNTLEEVDGQSNLEIEQLYFYQEADMESYEFILPTFEQVFEWFRSKNILGWVECQCNPEIEFYTRILVNGENFFIKGKRKPYKSYEECREALIEELLIIYNKFYGNK